MSDGHDEDDIEATMTSQSSHGAQSASLMDPRKDLAALFNELESLLKTGAVVAALTSRGVNASLALVALHGLREYIIEDKKVQAAEDFAMVSEEIFTRLAAAVIHDSGETGGSAGSGGFGDGSGGF